MNVDPYLERIAYDGPRAADLTTLSGLTRAHLLAVPFDGLDCHLGNRVTIEPADAYRKVVDVGRGGFCFELNGLFGWLLGELGFSVTRLSARPMIGDGLLAPPAAHLVLLVPVDGHRWLVDVGFGVPWASAPLDVDERGDQVRDGRRYRVTEDADGLLAEDLERDSRPNGYRFTLDPAPDEPFAARCAEYAQPTSVFGVNAPVQKLFDDGYVRVTRDAVAGRRGGRDLARALDGEADWRAALEEHFGLIVEGRDVRAPGIESPA